MCLIIYIIQTQDIATSYNNIGASPSGKAAGFGPAIPEVRILPPQPLKKEPVGSFLVAFSDRMRTAGENRASEPRLEALRAGGRRNAVNRERARHFRPRLTLLTSFFIAEGFFESPLTNMTFSHICSAECPGLIG